MRSALRSTSLAAGSLIAALALAGCAGQGDEPAPGSETTAAGQPTSGAAETVADEDTTDGGQAPEGMTPAEEPMYPVGTEVDLAADHMPGMMGSSASIVGAYDTTAYAVSFTPTDGGPMVSNHRWVVHEEIQDPPADPVEDGTQVTLAADGGEDMQGAEATIDSSTDTTAYLVDIVMDSGTTMTNQWVVESEVLPDGEPTGSPTS